jgi:hypothetical protein
MEKPTEKGQMGTRSGFSRRSNASTRCLSVMLAFVLVTIISSTCVYKIGESSRASALIIRPWPRHLTTALSARWCCPRTINRKGHSGYLYCATDSHGFSTHCLRFQRRLSLHWQDSLPMGGSLFPGGIRTHWTPSASFKNGHSGLLSKRPRLRLAL